jgi:hypothetical protein
MARDGVANMVERLRQHGYEPRRVADDAWESRCPGHGGLEHELSITRSEFNHAVLECRGTPNCQHMRIIRAVGFTNDHLYAETPDWLIGRLKREPIQRESNGNSATPSGDHAPLNTPHAEITMSSPDLETTRALALAEASPVLEGPAESPGEVFRRLAGVERVIAGSDGRSYAVVSVDGRWECCEVRSRSFRHWLARAGMKATGKVPSPDAVSAAVAVLEAEGEFAALKPEVFIRVARGPSDSSYFLDLADHDGRMIEIRADGWEKAIDPPVLMRRARGQLALPMPARDGSLELLKNYVNVEETDWPLFIGWLTSALRPVGPHPILVLTGEQGAAKTTLLKVCRRLIDPNSSPVRSQPKELRDLMVAARKSWLLAYDNLTSLPNWFSNGLCGLATGTGFTMRALGTDDEEVIFVAERPIILNGITDFVDRTDVADRSYFLQLPPISRSNRRTEQAFWADFERDCARLLGSLLDAVSAGMQMLPDVHLTELSRMADAERWGEAVVRGLGWPPGTFSAALNSNRRDASAAALDESPVAATLIEFLIEHRLFFGTMSDLLPALTAISRFKTTGSDWPKTPRSLSCKLRQIAPQLRSMGIEVEFAVENHNRIVTIGIMPDTLL